MNDLPVSAAKAAAVLGDAREGDLRLALDSICQPDGTPGQVLAYRFGLLVDGEEVGTISLRVGDDERLVRYAGQIGYGVDPAFRGRRLAERATRLLLPLARAHGLDPLWITCNPDNAASTRTIERLGAVLVELVDLPPDHDRYAAGERRTLRYRISLGEPTGAAL